MTCQRSLIAETSLDLRRETRRREKFQRGSRLQQQPLHHPCEQRHTSHEDVIQGRQILPGGRRGNTESLILERHHFFATSRRGVATASVQQPRLAGSDDGHPGGDRRRHRRGGSKHRRGWRGWHRHVCHSGCKVELADAARYEVLKVQRALLLTVLLVMMRRLLLLLMVMMLRRRQAASS